MLNIIFHGAASIRARFTEVHFIYFRNGKKQAQNKYQRAFHTAIMQGL